MYQIRRVSTDSPTYLDGYAEGFSKKLEDRGRRLFDDPSYEDSLAPSYHSSASD